MQKEALDKITIPPFQHILVWPDTLLRQVESVKLFLRAEKYRHKEDPGGIAYMRRHISEGDTVFDIGAHKAGYLYYFLQLVGNTGHVYAFEPQSVLFNYLEKLQHLLHWQHATIEPFAVSEQSGTATLSIPYNHGKPSSPCATIIESNMQFNIQNSEQVRTICIDDYCRIHAIVPQFLKVDVEGNELMVFKGAEKTLLQHKPRILFECETRFVGLERMLETFNFLENTGYKGYFIKGNDIHPIHHFNPAIHQSVSATHYCNNFIFE